jgi:hypothetical protein
MKNRNGVSRLTALKTTADSVQQTMEATANQ